MKKILLICLATLLGAGISMAAKPAAGKKTAKTVFVTDIDCDHCVKKIMDNVPSLGKGVKDVEVDLAKPSRGGRATPGSAPPLPGLRRSTTTPGRSATANAAASTPTRSRAGIPLR